jgi:hypothetical protein
MRVPPSNDSAQGPRLFATDGANRRASPGRSAAGVESGEPRAALDEKYTMAACRSGG